MWNLRHTPLNPRTLWSMFVRLTELTVARSEHLRPGRRDYSLSLSVKSEPFKSAQLVSFWGFFGGGGCFFRTSLFIETYRLHRSAQHKHSAETALFSAGSGLRWVGWMAVDSWNGGLLPNVCCIDPEKIKRYIFRVVLWYYVFDCICAQVLGATGFIKKKEKRIKKCILTLVTAHKQINGLEALNKAIRPRRESSTRLYGACCARLRLRFLTFTQLKTFILPTCLSSQCSASDFHFCCLAICV